MAADTELRRDLHRLFIFHLKHLLCTTTKGQYEYEGATKLKMSHKKLLHKMGKRRKLLLTSSLPHSP